MPSLSMRQRPETLLTFVGQFSKLDSSMIGYEHAYNKASMHMIAAPPVLLYPVCGYVVLLIPHPVAAQSLQRSKVPCWPNIAHPIPAAAREKQRQGYVSSQWLSLAVNKAVVQHRQCLYVRQAKSWASWLQPAYRSKCGCKQAKCEDNRPITNKTEHTTVQDPQQASSPFQHGFVSSRQLSLQSHYCSLHLLPASKVAVGPQQPLVVYALLGFGVLPAAEHLIPPHDNCFCVLRCFEACCCQVCTLTINELPTWHSQGTDESANSDVREQPVVLVAAR